MMVGQKIFSLLLLSVLISGCAGAGGNPRDPLEPMNRVVYQFNDKADHYVMKPVAEGYRTVTPQPFRNSVRNFFSNLCKLLSRFVNLFEPFMSDIDFFHSFGKHGFF